MSEPEPSERAEHLRLVPAVDGDHSDSASGSAPDDGDSRGSEPRDSKTRDSETRDSKTRDSETRSDAELATAKAAESVSGSDAETASEADADALEEPAEVTAARAVLADADAVSFFKSMSGLARTSQSSLLGPMPYSAGYSYHDPSCVVADPEPVGPETVALYCRAAYPDFDQILGTAFMDPALDPVLTEIFHLLTYENSNVAIVTNHGQIIDIALVIGAFLTSMCDSGRTFGVLGEVADPDDLANRSNVVVSRMVATRQAIGLPVVQLLQSGTRVFFSVPQTQSRRRAKLDPELVRANNVVMRHELDKQMSLGGQVLAMAASGSQDISAASGLVRKARTAWRQRRGDEPPETATMHLQPLYNGTMNLMLGCKYVLPVAISLESETPGCVVGSVTRVHSGDECHRVMDWIAEAHQRVTGVPTVYHWHEDDLLTHVRSLINR